MRWLGELETGSAQDTEAYARRALCCMAIGGVGKVQRKTIRLE